MRARDNIRPHPTVRDALSRPRRDFARVVLPPMRYPHEQDKVTVRRPAARRCMTRNGLNERFGPSEAPVGIVVQGGMDNGVIRALQRLGLADIHGDTVMPLCVLDVTYPLVASGFLALCEGKEAVPVVEEGQPAFVAAAVGLPLSREDPHATP
jgi:indolepyruvate ferredoxin oxidoreductase alpha subunit